MDILNAARQHQRNEIMKHARAQTQNNQHMETMTHAQQMEV
jgi:hypothetical protein